MTYPLHIWGGGGPKSNPVIMLLVSDVMEKLRFPHWSSIHTDC